MVSRALTADGASAARWPLRTDAPAEVPAAQVALWYYGRWRAGGSCKLLESAGQQPGQWQQRAAAALARRLLVARGACAAVWRPARDSSPQAAGVREVLIRLSGRQMEGPAP